ncbi:MAG: chemotaxis protein CheW [Gammaproteobacteria bacterium]|nr:chemotaxis protein CheW [Gammaproteobacteria bacterium]
MTATAKQTDQDILDDYFLAMLTHERPLAALADDGQAIDVDTRQVSAAPLQNAVDEIFAPIFSGEIRALRLQVDQRNFAVPLLRLRGVANLRTLHIEPVTAAGYVIGQINYREHEYTVIDLAYAGRHKNGGLLARQAGGFVVFVDNGTALLADQIDQTLNLDAVRVSWRGHRHNTRWIAGLDTVSMCAIVDVDRLVHMS